MFQLGLRAHRVDGGRPLRRSCQATVLFREALYDAGLLSAFGVHASRWRHVMTDIAFHYGDGFRSRSPRPRPSPITLLASSICFITHCVGAQVDRSSRPEVVAGGIQHRSAMHLTLL